MKYKVIYNFTDLQDNNHVYNIGDDYPHKGRVKKERAEELASEANKIGVPLIMPMDDGGE